MRVSAQDVVEKLLLLAAHAALGIFFSGAFGLLLYVVMVPIVQSFWSIADINFALLAVLTIGSGATVGTFLAWLNRDLSRSTLLLDPVSHARGDSAVRMGGTAQQPGRVQARRQARHSGVDRDRCRGHPGRQCAQPGAVGGESGA